MFRKIYNQAVLEGRLRPNGPVLIVKGGAALDPVAPDLAFVRSVRFGEETVYLPGSSLKGVLRAHAERLLATEVDESAAEDPFESKSPRRLQAKAKRDDKDHRDTAGVFQLSCEADRLFGSTEIGGRFRIGDAYPPDLDAVRRARRTEVRYGVAINRAKQSVQVGPFEQEAVTDGEFAFTATLENFELWMLSLVLQVFSDLHAGLIQIGHAKSRGFGTVTVEKPVLTIRWPGEAAKRLEGAGAREKDAATRRAYGLHDDDWAELPSVREDVREGLFAGYRFTGWEGLGAALQEVSGAPWGRFVERARTAAEKRRQREA